MTSCTIVKVKDGDYTLIGGSPADKVAKFDSIAKALQAVVEVIEDTADKEDLTGAFKATTIYIPADL